MAVACPGHSSIRKERACSTRNATFARYPYIPTRTSPEQLLSIYLARCEESPRFRLADLDRHVLAIDVRRFDPEAIEDALEGVVFAPSFWELEHQLDDLLRELLLLHGDPTLWNPLLHQMPPLLTTDEVRCGETHHD